MEKRFSLQRNAFEEGNRVYEREIVGGPFRGMGGQINFHKTGGQRERGQSPRGGQQCWVHTGSGSVQAECRITTEKGGFPSDEGTPKRRQPRSVKLSPGEQGIHTPSTDTAESARKFVHRWQSTGWWSPPSVNRCRTHPYDPYDH